MAEYNNPLSGFLGGFSAPLIAREKEDRLLKNQLGLIGLQNELATNTATATREFETINQTLTSYSSRRDKLTEERNKMLRSAYAPGGSNNFMALSPAQSNARIREMGFEPGYFKIVVEQMNDQIHKLGVGIDQMMIYRTNKYGPAGVSFKHISSIGGLPRPRGDRTPLTGQEVTPTIQPVDTFSKLAGGVGKLATSALDVAKRVGGNVYDAVAEAGEKAAGEIIVHPDQEFRPDEGQHDKWGRIWPGSEAIVEGGITAVPAVLDKFAASLGAGIVSKDNVVNKLYEAFSRILGIDPTQTADFWFGKGSAWGKIKAAGKQIPKDFFRLIDRADALLIQFGFTPPGYEKNRDGQIVLIPGSVRDLMQKEAAATAAAGATPDTSSVDALKGIYQANPIEMDLATPPPLATAPTEGTIPIYDPLRFEFDNDESFIRLDLPDFTKRLDLTTKSLEQTNEQNEAIRQRMAELERRRAEQMISVAEQDAANRAIAAQASAQDAANRATTAGNIDLYSNPQGLSGEELDAIIATSTERYRPPAAFDTFSGIETAGDAAAQYKEDQDAAAATDSVVQQANQVLTELENEALGAEEGEGYWTEGRGLSAGTGAAAIILAEIAKRRYGNTVLEAKGKSIKGGASARELRAIKKNIKAIDKMIRAQKINLKRAKKNPKYGNPVTLEKELNKLKGDVSTAKAAYKNHVINRRWRVGGRIGKVLGLFVIGAGQVYAGIAGEEAANDFMYEIIEGNEEVINIAVKIAERTKTPFDLLIEQAQEGGLSDNPFRKKLAKNIKTENIMDATLPTTYNDIAAQNMPWKRALERRAPVLSRFSNRSDLVGEEGPRTSISQRSDSFIDVGQGDYYGRDADRESFGMKDWYDQQAREQKRTQAPRTSIRKRSDVESADESESTLDDLINWITSLSSKVVPEAAASDVPIESIGLAREVPDMLLNNPRIGFGPKISSEESNGVYDAIGFNTVTKEARPPDPMVRTSKWSDVRAKYGDTLGIGKYQFTNGFLVDIYADTLNSSKKDAQIFLDNKVFKDSMQEQALALAFGYLGLEDVIRGKMSAKAFVNKIEGRWHGIAKAIKADPNYKQVMIDDLEGMVEQATGRTFTLSNRE